MKLRRRGHKLTIERGRPIFSHYSDVEDRETAGRTRTGQVRYERWPSCSCGWSDGPVGSPTAAVASFNAHIEDVRKRAAWR